MHTYKYLSLPVVLNEEYLFANVIGFDNVIVMMDENFKYSEEGDLLGREHPNPDYLLHKLFYQAVSRAREKLCIVVLKNKKTVKRPDYGQMINDKMGEMT